MKAKRAAAVTLTLIGTVAVLDWAFAGEAVSMSGPAFQARWLSIIPPLLAIGLAVALREVVVALFLGVWAGATILAGWHPVAGLARAVDTYVVDALADRDHARVVLFSLLLGGMVGIVTRSGGTAGIVERISAWAGSRRAGQLSTWAMGLVLFFDDYASVLITGSTMRPLGDRLRISREKLAYIVDCTAAPMASMAIISTWIGFEVGLIGDALAAAGGEAKGAYALFLQTLPYRFYSIFALWLVFLIASSGRDFGPMRRAEMRVALEGRLLRDGARPLASNEAGAAEPPPEAARRWWNAAVPILAVIGIALAGIYGTGRATLGEGAAGAGVREAFQAGDSFRVLMWASAAGCLIAGGLALVQGILSLGETLAAWLAGMKSMLIAMVVLILAWALSAVCKEMETATFVTESLGGVLSAPLIPAATFLCAALVAFATGTSWGTMAIMVPLAVQFALAAAPGEAHILLGALGAVLAGACFGDHSSPISDTTILSSMSTGCDHIDHVRTQIPYALVAAGASCLLGYIPAGFGLSPWISLIVGDLVLAGPVRFFGKKIMAK